MTALLTRLFVGLLLAGLGSAPAQKAPDTQVRLEVRPQADRFAVGQPVKLDATVTNNGAAACGLVDLAAGSLQVVDGSRDGKALAPSFVHSLLVNGVSQLLIEHLKSTPAGGSVRLPVEVGPENAIEAVTPLRDGSALTAMWPVDAPGQYQFHLRYQVPTLAGDTACAGSSDTVVVKFRVGESANQSWWLIAAIGLVLLVLIGVTWFLVRRHRRRPGPSAAVLILVVALVVTVLNGRPAQAIIEVHDTGLNPTITTFWNNCLDGIRQFDKSIDNLYIDPNVKVDVYFWFFTERYDVKGKPHDSKILWDPTPGGYLEPGVPYDPCAELYHELIHARDAANDSLSGQYCDEIPVLVDEVRATIEENKYRQSRKPPLPIRTTYDGYKIPLTSVNDCFRNQYKAKPGPNDRCRAVNGPCHTGHTTGDPHVFTLDGGAYDFQAVGEFVALHADDGEIQVRQAAYRDSRLVAVNSAVAIKVGEHKLGFYLSDQGISVHLDGKPATVLLGDTDLGGGAHLYADKDFLGTQYSVMWSDTMIASVRATSLFGLNLDVSAPSGRKVSGLLGDRPGDSPGDLYGAFADHWRVTDATSLFDYAAGQSTATFTDKSFPDKAAKPVLTDGAKDACRLLGIPAGPLFDACVVDVSVTGQADFGVGTADVALPPLSFTRLQGDHAVLTVDTPGGSAGTTIHGEAGQRLYVQVTATDLPPGCSPLHLLDPQGKPIDSGCLGNNTGEIDGHVLPATGDYSVELQPVNNATGSVSLRLFLSTDQVQNLLPDKDYVVTIGTPGAVSFLKFAATAGQRIFVDLPSYALPSGCGAVSLVDSNGFGWTSSCAGSGMGLLDTFTIPSTGAWALKVDPFGAAVGQVLLRMSFINDVSGTIAINGPEVVTTLTQPGSRADYTFTATFGQKITLDISGSTFPDECGLIAFVDPNNFVQTISCTSNGSGQVQAYTIPVTGTWTVRVDPPDRRVGTAHIRLHT